MNQVLEFLAENYIYVAGGSAIIIVILLIIIFAGSKKEKKNNKINSKVTNNNLKNGMAEQGNYSEGANANMGIAEPVLESVPSVQPIPTVDAQASVPVMDTVQVAPVTNVQPMPAADAQVNVPVMDTLQTSSVTEEKKEDTLEVFDL